MEDDKIVTEFMGYKLVKCNTGMAWISPYKKASEDIFNLHGRLWRENDTYYKFHTSWDWLMPVVEKIVKDSSSAFYAGSPNYLSLSDKWQFSMLDDQTNSVSKLGNTLIEATYKAVVEFINWYNKNKEK